jgi:hypothetical protein
MGNSRGVFVMGQEWSVCNGQEGILCIGTGEECVYWDRRVVFVMGKEGSVCVGTGWECV